MPRLKASFLLSLATLLAPALMLGQGANPAAPGTLNYIEGQVSINGQVVDRSSVGSIQLNEEQMLETKHGKAEVLLTPGVFLRLGDNSAIRMISPALDRTEVQLAQGRADVEVDQLFKQNDLRIQMKGAETQLLKTGLYAFDSANGTVQVFDGQAVVSQADGRQKSTVVKKDHELTMNADGKKPEHFDEKTSEDTLYNWSSLRSQYLGEANVQLASAYAGEPGFAPGWFWDSGLYGYTWLPGDGAFFDPFGYGFYSPYYLYGGGFVYGFGGRGFHHGRYPGEYGHGQTSFRGYRSNGFQSAHSGGGFHGGAGGFHGGGGFGTGGGSHGGGGGHR